MNCRWCGMFRGNHTKDCPNRNEGTVKKLSLMLLMLLISSIAYAEFDLTVGPEVSHISYREKNLTVGPQIITMKEDGVMYGIRGIAEYTDKVYLALDGKYSVGQIDYSGTGSMIGIDNQMVEVRGLVGFQVAQAIIYSGYGYRNLNDDAHGKVTSDGSLGYERNSTYHYLPIGVKFKGFVGELDVLLSGEQVSYLDRLGFDFPRITQKQRRGAGAKLSYNFSKTIGKFDIVFTPFLRAWKIQDSEVSGQFIEPKNTSIEAGGGVSIKF